MTKPKVVPSKLYTTASKKVAEKVEEELEIPDPPEDEAVSSLLFDAEIDEGA